MFQKKEELIKLIQKKLEELEKEIKSIESSVSSIEKVYLNLKEDINNIIYIDKKDLENIVSLFDIPKKEELLKELTTIKKILTMNKDYSSTLRLFKKNKESFAEFITYFESTIDTLKNNNKEKNAVLKKQEEYESLIDNVISKNFQVDKKTIALLEPIFSKVEDKEQEEILLELIKYENENYKNVLDKSKLKDKATLAEEDLIQVFNKYGYNYKSLEKDYKEYLKDYGNLNNIDEVFLSLKENNYPLIRDSFVLTSILLGSNKETINIVTSFSREHKLIPKSLLDISGALLEQRDFNGNLDDYSYMTIGSSLDFMRNIITLKDAGLSINYIYQECKSILTMPNNLLKKNLELFNMYGFSFEYKRRGIIDPSPAALLSTNFSEVCDAFIEIHPLGLKYLTDNLSNAKTVSNPCALMFYNIYAAKKLEELNSEDSPFRKVLEENNENYQLKAIITRNRPDFRNTYYQDINEENKEKLTNTLQINRKGTKKYRNIIENDKNDYINDSIFNNAYIKSIDKYLSEENALYYDFKGIRISRLKVLRVYDKLLRNKVKESLDSFMFSITYNTIIDKEKYNVLLDCVSREIEVGD